jgi:hypothetical protein
MRLPLQTSRPLRPAILPNRVLDEPGKGLRKGRIELPSIDPRGHCLNDLGPLASRLAKLMQVRPQQRVIVEQTVGLPEELTYETRKG